MFDANFEYLIQESTKLLTVVLLSTTGGRSPTVVIRSPYVDRFENEEAGNIAVEYLNEYKNYLKSCYAVVFQHCRGRGKRCSLWYSGQRKI